MSNLTDASWITGGLGFLGDLFSGGLGMLSTAKSNKENRKQWKRHVRLVLHMAKNAHQYEVQDLRKAGLNPILSATGGNGATANIPSAAPAQAADVPDFGGTLVDSLNSAAALKNAENQGKAIDSQNAVNAAQVEKINAEKQRIEQEIAIKSAQAEAGKLGGKVAKKAVESGNFITDPDSWLGLKHLFVDPDGKGPDTSRPVSSARGKANQSFLFKRDEELKEHALKSKQKEIWTTDFSLVDAFLGDHDWIPVRGYEKGDYGLFVFKNIKDGRTKTIHYKLKGKWD